MRQFITWRFWLSIVALVVLTGGLIVLTRDDAPPVALPADLQPAEREIDLVGLVFLAQADAGFTILDEELGAEQYGIAFRSGDQELCDTIEGAVQQLVDNGTYAKIAAKYPDIVNNLTYLNK